MSEMVGEDMSGYDIVITDLVPILISGARLLSGPGVNIFVGPKRKCFVVHATLLCQSCACFKRRLRGIEQNEDTNKEFYLPDDDTEVFQLFHTWLYSQKLKPIVKRCKEKGGTFEDDHIGSTELYFNLYYMAEARNLHSLQNLTMDRLRQYYATENRIPGSERCEQVYQRTKPGSPLRSLMVQQFLSIYTEKKQTSETAAKALCARLQMKKGETFMVDMFEAVRRRVSKRAWPFPNDENGCVFHYHEIGQVCGGSRT